MMVKKEEKAVQESAPQPEVSLQVQDAANSTTDLALVNDDLLAGDAGLGSENVHAGDMALPFRAILQKGSPQVSRANAKYIQGSVPGMFLDTVTGDVFDGEKGFDFINCGFNTSMVRWKSRDSGGGLVCHYSPGDPILRTFKQNERGQLFDPDTDDVIIDTAYHYGLCLEDDGTPTLAVISMYATQLSKSRKWNTMIKKIIRKDSNGRAFNPPRFAFKWRLKTKGETKDQYDWFGWDITLAEQITDAGLYVMAKKFAEDIKGGKVRVSAPPRDFDTSGEPDVPLDAPPF
jgi:hypothetical protein